MRIVATELVGVHRIEVDPHFDERGLFARTFDADALNAAGLTSTFVHGSTAFNERALTLRGMHYQAGDDAETKIVRCTRGRVFDVAVDLRRDSPTFLKWTASELTADNRTAMYIPAGCAHGLLTLENSSEVAYLMDRPYRPASDRGVRWDDPSIGINWPAAPQLLSARDAALPLRDSA